MGRNTLPAKLPKFQLCVLGALSVAAVAAGQRVPTETRPIPQTSATTQARVIDFAPRANRLLAVDRDGILWLRRAQGEAGQRISLNGFGRGAKLALSDDGEQLVVAEQNGEISLVDTRSGTMQRTFRAAVPQIPIAISLLGEDGSVALIAERAGVVTWQRYSPGREPMTHSLPIQPPVALSASGARVVGRDQDRLVLWSPETQRVEGEFEESGEAYTALALSPDGEFLGAVTQSGPVRIVVWEARSGSIVRTFASPVAGIAKLRFDPDQPQLSILDDRGEIVTLNLFARAAMAVPPPEESSPLPPFSAEAAEAPEEADVQMRESQIEGELDKPYVTVPVYYGTNRLPRSEEDSEWAYQFREFFITTTAFVLYAICFILPLGVAILFSPRRRVTAAVFGGSVLLLLAAASVYAVVRADDIEDRPGEYYGFRRGPLEYGRCEVTVPKVRELGVLNSPPSVWVFRGPENAAEHIVLRTVAPYEDANSFVAALREHTVSRGEDELLIYIHGYNTTFEDAARRAAQLAVDLEMSGPPVFFSWPSHGNAARYTFDQTNALAADPYLRAFLETLVRRCKAKKIHVLAHSMGNVVLADALRELTRSLSSGERAIVHEVVLAAPDLDRSEFLDQIAPAIASNHHVTLYVSSRDVALQTSRRFHAYQRAGEVPEITLFDGIDTIDASTVDTSRLGHSYYSEQVAVLEDLSKLLRGKPPEDRDLHKLEAGGRPYWSLVKRRTTTASDP